MSTPILHVLAGPNGSGKSTFADRVLIPATGLPFINADVLAAERWPGDESSHAYEASQLAMTERTAAMHRRSSFITETVFSHPSKLDLVRLGMRMGYLVALHVLLVPEDLSVARVAFRVDRGGHDVPEVKIRERHRRLWQHIAAARDLASRTTVYDNSRAATPFRRVAVYELGRLVDQGRWPAWAPAELLPTAEPDR